MASVHAIAPQRFTSFIKEKRACPRAAPNFHALKLPQRSIFSRNGRKLSWALNSAVEEIDVIPVQSADFADQQEGVAVSRVERESVEGEMGSAVGGFGELSLGGAGEIQGFSSSGSVGDGGVTESGESEKVIIDRIINATIVLAAGSYAITKLLTIDQDYWHVSHTVQLLQFNSFLCLLGIECWLVQIE